MTIGLFCIVVAIFIPLFCAGYAKFSKKGYNNRQPREFLEGLEGKARRAHYAQLNSFEAFSPFAAAIIVAHYLQGNQQTIDTLAVSFIVARILYALFYIFDQHVFRTIAWFTGLFITISLFFV
jgi:uncharacterized MAPEG superfamily protein